MKGLSATLLKRGMICGAAIVAMLVFALALGFASPMRANAAEGSAGLVAGSPSATVQEDQGVTMRDPKDVSLWAGDTTNWALQNFVNTTDYNLAITSVVSSNSSVLKVNKWGTNKDLSSYSVQTPKAGKATLKVAYKQNGVSKTISATYTVKKFSDGISSITFNGASMKVPTSKAAINTDDCFQFKGIKATLVVKTKNGWETSHIHGYFYKNNSSANQEAEITNGKSFYIKKGYQGTISINFYNSKTGENFWYRLGVYRDKPLELATKATYFVGYPKKRTPIVGSLHTNTSDLTVLSVTSSNSAVLKVAKKNKKFDKIMLQAKKAGTSKLTIKYKYKGKTYTTTSKCTVPDNYPLKSVKVNGKSLKLKKSPYGYSYTKYNKDTAKVKFTAAAGWKLKKVAYVDDTSPNAKSKKIKNGAAVDTPKGKYTHVVATLKKGKTTFSYAVYFQNI